MVGDAVSEAQGVGIGTHLMRAFLLIATLAVAVFNGLSLSWVFDSVDYILGVTLRGPYLTHGTINAYVTPAAIAIMTVAIAGIPAAVYERIRRLPSSTAVSLAIWLIAATLLASPAIRAAWVIADDFQ